MEDFFDFVPENEDDEEVQWEYTLSKKQTLLYSLKFVVIAVLPFPFLSMLFPILGLANWYIVLLVGGAVLFTLGIASFAMWRSGAIIAYTVTAERIIVWKGTLFVTTYDNIKSVKLKKSKRKKNTGTVKIYVKKGLSLNYHIVGVPNPEEVYHLIMNNKNR